MVPVTEKKKPPMYYETFIEGSVSPVKLLTNNTGIAAKRNSGAIEGDGDSDSDAEASNDKFSFYKLWMYTGPGWLMSIAYLDPGNSKLIFNYSTFIYEEWFISLRNYYIISGKLWQFDKN